MIVRLKYGEGARSLRLPSDARAEHWNLDGLAAAEPLDPEARTARVRAELAESPAGRLSGRRLALLLADGTREVDPEASLVPLAPVLRAAASLTTFLCTGTHDPALPETARLVERVRRVLGELGCPTDLHVHDGRGDLHADLGRTRSGTPVEVLASLAAYEGFVTVSDMKPHYFAGYSNATKYLVPGLASVETARANHALALEPGSAAGRHPWHPDADRRGNPLAADLVEAYERALGGRPSLVLAQVRSAAGTLWVGAGEAREVTARGIRAVDRCTSLRVEPVPRLVLSAGGAPYDESLYTAQRALELAREAVLPGGELLFLARCPNGIGPAGSYENFYLPLTRPADERPRGREGYVLYGHKPVKLARLRSELGALHLASELEPESVERMGLRPAPDPQAVLDGWLADAPSVRVGFLDDGARLSVRGTRPPQVPMP